MYKNILFLLLFTANSYGQNIAVRGSVSTTSGPVRFASVTFIDQSDTTKESTALTDTLGNYSLGLITSVNGRDNRPVKIELAQNYPNPFSSSTAIPYELKNESDVSLGIYNILGQNVKEYCIGVQQFGAYGVQWDGTNNDGKRVAPGIYFYQLRTEKDKQIKKMIFTGSGGSPRISTPVRVSYTHSVTASNLWRETTSHVYTVAIRSIDSTQPRISSTRYDNIAIDRDTTLNYSVEKVSLIANAGPDQVITIGSYTVVDGTVSGAADGDSLIYTWEGWENNPEYMVYYPNRSRQEWGFIVPGTYKFFLTVGNGIDTSEPDTIVITANQRDSSLTYVFEDPAMELSVRYALHYPTGEFSDEALFNIDSLQEYVILSIRSLKGIERCINLKKLYMSIQYLTDITPLESLVNLEVAMLDQNQIEDISPLSSLVNLQDLTINTNKVTDISPLTELVNLRHLDIMYNPISDISVVSGMELLEDLWISDTLITELPALSGMNNLGILWITGCRITDISGLSSLTNLKHLNLDVDRITDISPLSNLTNLEWLYLGNNQIVDITPLTNLTKLVRLRLIGNRITNILPLVNNPGLQSGSMVHLTGNPLDDVSINQYIPILENRGVAVVW